MHLSAIQVHQAADLPLEWDSIKLLGQDLVVVITLLRRRPHPLVPLLLPLQVVHRLLLKDREGHLQAGPEMANYYQAKV